MPTFISEIQPYNFSEKCPICGNPGCCIRYGTYKRKSGVVLQRYLCTVTWRKSNKKKYRTISVLPWPLIPYRTYDILTLLTIIRSHENGASYMKIANGILPEEHSIEYGIMLGLLIEYLRLWKAIFLKWSFFTKEYKNMAVDIRPNSIEDLTGMAMIYWHIMKKFLVGTPSQFRKSRPPPKKK